MCMSEEGQGQGRARVEGGCSLGREACKEKNMARERREHTSWRAKWPQTCGPPSHFGLGGLRSWSTIISGI